MKKKMMIYVFGMMGFINTTYSMSLDKFATGAGAAWAVSGAATNTANLANMTSGLFKGVCSNPSKKAECIVQLKDACKKGLDKRPECKDASDKYDEGVKKESGDLDGSINMFKLCIANLKNCKKK